MDQEVQEFQEIRREIKGNRVDAQLARPDCPTHRGTLRKGAHAHKPHRPWPVEMERLGDQKTGTDSVHLGLRTFDKESQTESTALNPPLV